MRSLFAKVGHFECYGDVTTATLKAPLHVAASIAKFQLVFDRVRFLSGRQWRSGLLPTPWNHPFHRVLCGRVVNFAVVPNTPPVDTPASNFIWFDKHV